MMRVNHLLGSSGISVLRLDHPPGTEHLDSEEEVCANYAVNFVEAGSFGLGAGQKSWTLSPGYLFLSRPGAVHRYTHHERAPSDVCVSVIFSESFVQDIDRADHFVSTRVPVATPPTNRLAFLRLRLTQLASDGYSLALEDWACELLSAIRDVSPGGNRLYRQAQLRWYAERVEAVRERFETRYAESHSLASIARSVGMSPFQFARVFSELAGLPPHRYLLGVRLDRAAKMLLDGYSAAGSLALSFGKSEAAIELEKRPTANMIAAISLIVDANALKRLICLPPLTVKHAAHSFPCATAMLFRHR